MKFNDTFLFFEGSNLMFPGLKQYPHVQLQLIIMKKPRIPLLIIGPERTLINEITRVIMRNQMHRGGTGGMRTRGAAGSLKSTTTSSSSRYSRNRNRRGRVRQRPGGNPLSSHHPVMLLARVIGRLLLQLSLPKYSRDQSLIPRWLIGFLVREAFPAVSKFVSLGLRVHNQGLRSTVTNALDQVDIDRVMCICLFWESSAGTSRFSLLVFTSETKFVGALQGEGWHDPRIWLANALK